MKNYSLKMLTRCIAQSHKNVSYSTRSNLSPTPQPQTSTPPVIPSPFTVSKKEKIVALLWFFAGFCTYGVAETYKIIQTEIHNKHLEQRREDLELKPMKLNRTKDVDSLGFRRVVCKGVFDKQRSIYVGPKTRSTAEGSENGYYVLTPLLPIPKEPYSMKSPILVNRGWIPLDWEKSLESKDDDVVVATANESGEARKLLSSQLNPLSKFWYWCTNKMIFEETATLVEVVGLVRKSEIPGTYALAMYPKSLEWFYLDVPKLAQALGLGEDTIYVEQTHKDMDESRPYPAPRDIEDIILSKNTPLNMQVHMGFWYWISLACFSKANPYMNDPTVKPYYRSVFGQIPIFTSGLLYIFWKISSRSNLFCIIDTLGVGCVTKLDQQQKEQVNDSIDLVRDLF